MADAAIFIGWGSTIVGREQKALQVFNEVMQHYAQLQQRGEIESFEPVALEPHGGDLAGFLLIRGTREQLNRLRASDDYQRLNARGLLVVQNFGAVDAYVGEGLGRLFGTFQQQLAELA
jgi:hypothetical protein